MTLQGESTWLFFTELKQAADDFCPKPVEPVWLVDRLTKPSARGRVDTVLELLEATGGVEGLRLARRDKPQVIFLEMMPDMTGFEVFEELRADPATKELNVIVFSSKGLDDHEREQLARLTMSVMKKDERPDATLIDIKQALERAGVHPGQEG